MMPNDNIKELTDFVNQHNIPLKIHFSLHSPIEQKRKEIIPSSTLTINEIVKLLSDYQQIITNNKNIMNEYKYFHKTNEVIEIHYTLMKNINDTNDELHLLKEMLLKSNFAIKFIKFNPTDDIEISQKEEKWVKYLKDNNIKVKVYSPPGKEIGSSCGQFTKHYYHQEIETKEELKEFLEWEKLYKVN